MRAPSFPSQALSLLEREATALRDKVLQKCPGPTLAKGRFLGGSPLKAPAVMDRPPHSPARCISLRRGLLASRGEKGQGKIRAL